MEWRTVEQFPEHEISEAGDVRRTVASGRYPAGYMLTAKRHPRGYLTYSLNNRDTLAHRLVALAFHGEPPSPEHEVAHEDGSRTNNHWTNLRWSIPRDNQADRKRHGTFHAGERCGSARLTDAQAEEMRSAYADKKPYRRGGITMQSLAEQFGVSVSQVSRIINGRQRAHHRHAS